ncbi:MAG: hypothetical protein JO198_03095 [Candidatus Dormibacteraeota bacterium]|nr:hypothetical protein [Candidatus Dormibacteraeota bacterium]
MGIGRRWRNALVLGAVVGTAAAGAQGWRHVVEASGAEHGPTDLPGAVLVAGPPAGASGPDDLAQLSVEGLDAERALIWTAYQNGIGPDGSPTGAKSTVAGYDPATGALERSIDVVGKVDGLTADPERHVLYATVNEDANSVFNVINPRTSTVTAYTYTPSPETNSNGGTDAISIWHGEIFVSHSNPDPTDAEAAAVYRVRLDEDDHTAHLTKLFDIDASAADAVSGKRVKLALTDPDSNAVLPDSSPRFAGQLALISQGDGEIIFAKHRGDDTSLTVLSLTDNVSGNVPPIDGFAVATSEHGWLYIVDAGANTISRLSTDEWPAGTVFVTEPKDNANPLLGILDLRTGHVTPLANAFKSPKEILFVPTGDDD